MIYVRTKPDRIAFADEAGKQRIPSDRFIPVNETPWIRRLVDLLGDVEQQADAVASPAPSDASDTSSPVKAAKTRNA